MSAPGNKAAKSADEWLLNGSEPSKSTDPKANGGSAGGSISEERKPKTLPGEPILTETIQWVVGPTSDPGTAKETAVPSVHRPDAEVQKPDGAKVETADEALEEQRRENQKLTKRIGELETELRAQEKEAKTELANALAACDADLKRQLRAAGDDANERLEQATTALVKKHDSREQRLTKAFEKQREELIKAFEKQRDEPKTASEKSEAELRVRIDELSSKLSEAEEAIEAGKEASSKRRKTMAVSKHETGGRKARKGGGKNGKVDLNQASFEELRGLGLSVTQSARVVAYRDVRDGFESLDELDEIPGLSKKLRTDLRQRLSPPS